MAIIVPSILEDTIEGFREKAEAILAIPEVERIQVDVSDGKFTSRTTLSISDIEPLNPAYAWELHLMCENPESYFLDAKIAGFSTVLFPFEAVADKAYLIELANKLRELKIEPGLSVNPETSVEAIAPYVHLFNQVVFLSVQPGYQGQVFIEQTFAKVQKLRQSKKNVKIEVDGGINAGNAAAVAACGADYLVVGSALCSGASAAAAYEKIQAETNTNGKTGSSPT